MKKIVRNIAEHLQKSLAKVWIYFKDLPWWGKVIFASIFFLVKFVLPDVIFLPMAYKFIDWRHKKEMK